MTVQIVRRGDGRNAQAEGGADRFLR
jgi:hypothetical protein